MGGRPIAPSLLCFGLSPLDTQLRAGLLCFGLFRVWGTRDVLLGLVQRSCKSCIRIWQEHAFVTYSHFSTLCDAAVLLFVLD